MVSIKLAATLTGVILACTIEIVLSSTNKETTCEAGTFSAGESATVTCNFPVDTKADRLSISVFQYPLDSTSSDGRKDVLSCGWEENKAQASCKATEGFAYEYNNGEKVQIRIINASQKIAGRYVCHTVPPTGTCTPMCNLIIEEARSCPTATPNCSEQCPCTAANATCESIPWALVSSTNIGTVVIAFFVGYCSRKIFKMIRRIRSDKMNSNNSSREGFDNGANPGWDDPEEMVNPFNDSTRSTNDRNDHWESNLSSSVFTSQAPRNADLKDAAAQPLRETQSEDKTPPKPSETRKPLTSRLFPCL